MDTERGNLGAMPSQFTFGDSSPGGRAKGVRMLEREMERIRIDMLHSLFYGYPANLCNAFILPPAAGFPLPAR